jgi:hypothetical protein
LSPARFLVEPLPELVPNMDSAAIAFAQGLIDFYLLRIKSHLTAGERFAQFQGESSTVPIARDCVPLMLATLPVTR